MGRGRWIHADKYEALFTDLPSGQLLVIGHAGRSDFTFDALDRDGRRHLVWILDHQRIRRETESGPAAFTIRDWQRIGTSRDLLDKSIRTGLSQ